MQPSKHRQAVSRLLLLQLQTPRPKQLMHERVYFTSQFIDYHPGKSGQELSQEVKQRTCRNAARCCSPWPHQPAVSHSPAQPAQEATFHGVLGPPTPIINQKKIP